MNSMTDKEIVERAKEAEKRTGFGELVHSPISKGVNSAFGIGFIEGMVEYRNSMQEEPTAKIRGWVARQPEGELWLFAESPYYNSSLGSWGTAIGGERVLEGINTTMFKDLNFYDEPIEVELIIRKV